jgi:hypothetical protein
VSLTQAQSRQIFYSDERTAVSWLSVEKWDRIKGGRDTNQTLSVKRGTYTYNIILSTNQLYRKLDDLFALIKKIFN